MPQLCASFTRAKQPLLDIEILDNGRRERVATHFVANKREARQLATKLGATPWNF